MGKDFQNEELDLMLRKGVFPYDYMDLLEKLKDTTLPPIESFFSKLYDSNIYNEEYEHAQKVWKMFDMKTMRDYHNLYLNTDVLLLADVFENFRDVCMENYQLDPAWHYTAPGLAWDACLKYTKIKPELLSDPDMLLMFEKGIRGGISIISTRYGKANNPYMENFNSAEPIKYIPYHDANNLYGWAMSNRLLTHGSKWIKADQLRGWQNHVF